MPNFISFDSVPKALNCQPSTAVTETVECQNFSQLITILTQARLCTALATTENVREGIDMQVTQVFRFLASSQEQTLAFAQARLIKKCLVVATAVVSFFAGSKALATSELASGSGRNGAGFSGVSIPVEVDGSLTVGQFKNALTVCQQEVAKDLLSQILRQELTEVTFSRSYPNVALIESDRLRADFWVFVPLNGENSKPTFAFGYRDYPTQDPYLWSKAASYQLDPKVEAVVRSAQATRAQFFGGLAVNYETQQDSGYDELATLHTGDVLIRRYVVTESPVYRVSAKDYGSNELVKRPVALKTLSAREFKTCLENNFVR
jgi:hypothetical protein